MCTFMEIPGEIASTTNGSKKLRKKPSINTNNDCIGGICGCVVCGLLPYSLHQ
jgi:hypothetical protein